MIKRLEIILFILCACYSLTGFAQCREEFNGPFASWADIKKQFGAKGNGKDDDTRAIQSAINGLCNSVTKANSQKGAYTTVYLPAGTYCISKTLVLSGGIGVNIIGEDPHKTIIKWIGGNADTMFWANGSAYFRIGRLSWDANGHKNIEAIGIHWKNVWNTGNSKSFAPLNIEIADCIFKGQLYNGISGGTDAGFDGTGANDSEVTIKRCVFDNCTEGGISIHGYNALDYWIWDCQFLNCLFGIKNTSGNYHAYRCYFNGSTFSDLRNFNGYYTSMRGGFSENAFAFSADDGVSCNPFKRIFQNNTVVNIKKYPIEFYHIGKITLWDNRLSAVQDKKQNYWVHTGSWCPAKYEILSINNKFEAKDPLWNANGPLKKFEIGDTYNNKILATANDFFKVMESVPAKKDRKVFEVPAGADSKIIQQLINQAAALKGQRPIIHFGVGTWYLNKTLIIPAGSDLQLIGDGLIYATVLERDKASNFNSAALIQAEGPSYITIKDLQLGHESDNGIAAAIAFVNTDQPTSEAHIDQVYSMAATSLFVDGLDYLYIEKDNSFFTAGNYINGGLLTRKGKGTAKVCCYGGQFASLSVNNGGRFLAKDCWWEGRTRVPLELKGSGEISLDGAMIAPNGADSLPTIKIGEFNGKINLMNMYVLGSVAVNPGNSALNLLLWNINFYYKMNPYEYIKEGRNCHYALLGSNSQCFANTEACKNVISVPDKSYRISDTLRFIENNTAFDRSVKPVIYRNLPQGVSNIYVSRVTFGAAQKGISFTKQ
ncbi:MULTISPECIES: glycosyl hydrolase family 28-related protein [Niastella]|nr:glycosyl hydrolase family 28-related protein [Niastella soli]